MTFPEVESQPNSAVNQTRMKRQLADTAIAQATAAQWSEAAETNKKLLELGPDAEAENRLAKALWELGELGAAREHYQAALALDPTNRIAERNIDRLRTLIVAAGEKTVAASDGSKAPVRIFVEETGKTGFAQLLEVVGEWARRTSAALGTERAQRALRVGICGLTVVSLLVPLLRYAPFETAYFNSLTGGLGLDRRSLLARILRLRPYRGALVEPCRRLVEGVVGRVVEDDVRDLVDHRALEIGL